MANQSWLNKILAVSPYLEVAFRQLYWSNVGLLYKRAKHRKRQRPVAEEQPTVDLDKCLAFLRENGVGKGALVIVHAAYEKMGDLRKTPGEVVEQLLGVIGNEGTLAMPAMPLFRGGGSVIEYLDEEKDMGKVFVYDVQSTRIKTGALALALLKHPQAVRSRHPINTMVAVGKDAKQLMEGNLQGESPLPCGVYSSWYKCAEKDAWVVSFGTDLTHSLTMIHVAEDILDEQWPVQPWYREKKFLIQDGDYAEERTLRERRPKWGALHFAERTLCKDLLKNNIMKSTVIDGVLIEMLSSRRLLGFLQSHRRRGYPYFWT